MSISRLPPTPAGAHRFGAVTLVTTESYVIGAVVLGESLRRSGWQHETTALVTPEISAEARAKLARRWDRIVDVDHVRNPFPRDAQGQPYFETTFTKLRIWQQTGYTRLVYLDADTIVVGSIAELLERPKFAAAPCMWLPDYFNSGVLVVEPSLEVFDDMFTRLGTFPIYDGSDQGFLNVYFQDWYGSGPEHRLEAKFNFNHFLYMYAASWKWSLSDLRVLHYTKLKPWRNRSRLGRALVRRWAQTFTQAPREGLSPFEIWWQIHDSMEA